MLTFLFSFTKQIFFLKSEQLVVLPNGLPVCYLVDLCRGALLVMFLQYLFFHLVVCIISIFFMCMESYHHQAIPLWISFSHLPLNRTFLGALFFHHCRPRRPFSFCGRNSLTYSSCQTTARSSQSMNRTNITFDRHSCLSALFRFQLSIRIYFFIILNLIFFHFYWFLLIAMRTNFV